MFWLCCWHKNNWWQVSKLLQYSQCSLLAMLAITEEKTVIMSYSTNWEAVCVCWLHLSVITVQSCSQIYHTHNIIFLLLIKYCTNVHLVTKHIVAQCVQVSLWYLSQIWAKPTRFSNLDWECFTNACSSNPLLVCCCDCRLLIRPSVPASFPHTVLGSWA